MTLSASQRNRRALVLLGAAVAVYLLAVLVVFPAYDELKAAPAIVADKTEQLRKYRRELSHRGNYEKLRTDASNQIKEARGHFFSNDTAGAAEFQKMVEDTARATGIDLMQRTLGDIRKTGEVASEIAMTVTFESTPNQFVNFLSQLQSASKIVNVRSAQADPIQVAFELPKNGDLKKTLRVNLTLAGVAIAAGQDKVK